MTMIGSQQWMYSSGSSFYPHEVGSSVRFDNTGHLERTPSSTGNKSTWTFSAWIKRSAISDSGYNCIWSAGSASVNRDILYFDDNDRLHWDGYTVNAYDWNYTSTQKFRDTSAWYHIVVVQDTNQDIYSDRVKVYVNGEQITAWDVETSPNRYKTGYVNNTNSHTIGVTPYDTAYFDGYISEVNFVDGTALTPDSFGETKEDIWIPKDYTGSYGTNGYYLDFGNSGALGADSSENGNNWTITDIAATDQMPDSPTNNWATLNPIETNRVTMSNGNLEWSQSASYSYGQATIAIPPTGKYIIEGLFSTTPTNANYNTIGVISTAASSHLHTHLVTSGSGFYGINDADSYGQTFVEDGVRQGSITVPSGTVIQVLVDRDNNQLTFTKNGTLQTGTGATIDLPSDGDLWFLVGDYGVTGVVNFGQDSSFAGNQTAQGHTGANGIGDFHYAPPAGFLALCTANLPDSVVNPQDHFNTVLWTGNGSEPRSITGVGFQPDFVWSKARNEPYSSVLYDVVRGTGTNKSLVSNTNDAEGTYPTYHHISSLDSDGFTIGATSATNVLNNNNVTEVAWNWKAGGSGVSNSDGTITSTVSANTDVGFSIVTYTGTGSAGMTIGHGLSSAPELIIVKNRDDGSENWTVYSSSLGNTQKLELNLNLASATTGNWNNTSPSSSVFTLGSVAATNSSGDRCVAYCFHSVEGFSKFGTYTGNGSTDGPFIYTGFRPAFVLFKNTGGSENWHITDSKRDPYNESYHWLRPDISNAEASGSVEGLDMLSNGFKLKVGGGGWINTSGNTFLYMAFAEQPFKYANAR